MPDFANYATGVAILIIMLKYLDGREKKWEKRDEKWEKRDKEHADVSLKQVNSTEKLGGLVDDLSTYIKQHNGRQSEIHNETMEAFKLINAKLALNADVEHESTIALKKAIEEIKNQHVGTQRVDTQIIEGKK